jgi:hypothetical protein
MVVALRPWYRRPRWVVALLLFVPPLGIALLWWGRHFPEKVRIGLTIASALFFLVAVTRNKDEPSKGTAADTRASALAKEAQPRSPALAEAPAPDLMSVEKEPRLLLPATLNQFKLVGVNPLGECCQVVGYYQRVEDGRDADVYAMITSDKVLSEEKPGRAIKVGDHDGVSFIDSPAGHTRATVIWLAGQWKFTVNVAFKKPNERAAAVKAAEELAPVVAAHADRYVAVSGMPAANERKRHLDALASAVEERQRQEKAEELRRGSERFLAAARSAGIGSAFIVDGKRDPLLDDQLQVVVGPAWHRQVKQERLIAAQNLWATWAQINSPKDLDKSRLELVDVNGNEVGGSGILAGSTISVQD